MRRLPLLSLLVLVLVAAATAGPAVALAPLPETIPLPRGFEPEGIASGSGATLYAGSLSTGAVWAASSSTGRGERRVAPREGRSAAGLKVDRGRLFVAGAQTGNGYVTTPAPAATSRRSPSPRPTARSSTTWSSRAARRTSPTR